MAIGLLVSQDKSSALEGTTFAEYKSSSTGSEQPTPVDAFGYLGGILEARFYEPHPPADNPRDEIRQAAELYAVDFPMMLSIAKVESDFNPRARTGSYKGLFQLGEIEFGKYGQGSVFDARDNARAAAHMLLVQAEKFKDALGHYPDYAERYMVHQQGIEGAIEHYRHPERVAWQSMCATSEGIAKGERWCKRCIWGNLLPRWQRDFVSVDKILSVDFISLWTKRINLLANGYGKDRDGIVANPTPRAGPAQPALTARNSVRLRHIAARKLRATIVARANIGHSKGVKRVSIERMRTIPKRTIRAAALPLRPPAISGLTYQASAAY